MSNKRLLLITAVVVLILGALLFWLFGIVRATHFSPKRGAKNITPPSTIEISFNKKMAAASSALTPTTDGNLITITPAVLFTTSVTNKTITIIPTTSLSHGTTYQITIASVRAASGKAGRTVSFNFSTKVSGTDEVSNRAQFLSSLPYISANFSVDYISSGNFFSVEILQEPIEQSKAEAIKFLQERGVVSGQDTINFYVIPTLGGSAGP